MGSERRTEGEWLKQKCGMRGRATARRSSREGRCLDAWPGRKGRDGACETGPLDRRRRRTESGVRTLENDNKLGINSQAMKNNLVSPRKPLGIWFLI